MLDRLLGIAPAGVAIGGAAAQSADFVDAVYGKFPRLVALIAAMTFVPLARAFRSLVLSLKAVLLNLLSVAAAWGVMVLVWQNGLGTEAIWGIEATRAIYVEMPIVVFAFLFGVSMDHQVFIISRMREAYDRTGSTPAAVVEGIGRTGRLVTSAALILGLAFVALSASPGTEVKIFATALAAGILIDATIVRAILVPAVAAILGRFTGGCRSGRRGYCGSSPRWSGGRRRSRRSDDARRGHPVDRARGGRPPASPQPACEQVRRPRDNGQRQCEREQQDGRRDDDEDDPGHGEQEQRQQGDPDAGGEIHQLPEHVSGSRMRGRGCGVRVLHRP
jgi:hypothetical protein